MSDTTLLNLNESAAYATAMHTSDEIKVFKGRHLMIILYGRNQCYFAITLQKMKVVMWASALQRMRYAFSVEARPFCYIRQLN